jgi:hypothetical protein
VNLHTGQFYGYPYGSIPRLLLFWITTEAVQTKKRQLRLGDSLAEFMREIGLDPNTGGGKRSDAKRLRNQMERLFRCRISFEQATMRADGAGGKRWLDMQVAPKGEFWWAYREPEQGTLWESWLELGEDFFAAIIAAPVPVDMRALRGLKRSPLALDLYAWATYRAFSMSRRGVPVVPQFVPWRALMRQIGCDYEDVSNFRKKANKAVRKVRSVYPALNIENKIGGLEILPCPPAVLPAARA